MKKVLIVLTIALLLISGVYSQNNSVKINGIDFEIPSKYLGGELDEEEYELEDIFSIKCIDNETSKQIGLWASEKDFEEELNIANHPIRHYYQYNEYVHGNHSHAYFISGESIYEISWVGEDIDSDIENLIKKTPPSNINDDSFYNALDESIEIYKQEKIDKLNKEGEYNYLEAKLNSQNHQDTSDDTRFKEILITYMNR